MVCLTTPFPEVRAEPELAGSVEEPAYRTHYVRSGDVYVDGSGHLSSVRSLAYLSVFSRLLSFVACTEPHLAFVVSICSRRFVAIKPATKTGRRILLSRPVKEPVFSSPFERRIPIA